MFCRALVKGSGDAGKMERASASLVIEPLESKDSNQAKLTERAMANGRRVGF